MRRIRRCFGFEWVSARRCGFARGRCHLDVRRRRVMMHPRRVLLSLIVLAFATGGGHAAAQQPTSQGRSSVVRRQFVILNIRTSTGEGVPSAVAMVSEVMA